MTLCISVASSAQCVVDKSSAAANETVTYTCSVSAVCGGTIDVSLSLESNGVTKMTSSNTVTWTVTSGDVVDSMVTCMSTIECPKVTIEGGKFWTFCHAITSIMILL